MTKYRNLILRTLRMCLTVGILLGLLASGVETASAARQKKGGRKKAKTTQSRSSKKRKSKSKGRQSKKSPRGRSSAAGNVSSFRVTGLSVLKELKLDSGIVYYQYQSNGRRPIIANVLECDRSYPGNAIRLVKGEDHATGLERLKDMSQRFDSKTNHVLYGLVNGNFWRAVTNLMNGLCVIDGEVVQLSRWSSWSSALFDVRSQMTIDTFSLSGSVTIGKKKYKVESVNDRQGNGIVVYNVFGGNVVPFLSQKQLEKAFEEAVRDSSVDVNDSTEMELTQEMLRNEIANAQRKRAIEYPMVKIRVRYLRTPSINTAIACEVLGVDTGAVNMPLRGAVISIPRATLAGSWPKVRDTIQLKYETNVMKQTKFMNAICGTPRLVQNGIANSQARAEGSTATRFVHYSLARTAIGSSQDGKKIYIVAVPPDRSENGTAGANLQQMADIMSKLGCYNALNLDGGGSTGMVVRNDHVFYEGVDPLTRRVGLGVGVVRLAKILRSTGY